MQQPNAELEVEDTYDDSNNIRSSSETSLVEEEDNKEDDYDDNDQRYQSQLDITMQHDADPGDDDYDDYDINRNEQKSQQQIDADSEDDDTNDDRMPLFHYSRLYGSLPRTATELLQHDGNNDNSNVLESPCTCSIMGKLILTNETSTMSNDVTTTSNNDSTAGNNTDSISGSTHGRSLSISHVAPASTATAVQQDGNDADVNVEADDDDGDAAVLNNAEQTSLWMNETIPILGMGFQDGNVLLMDSQSGLSVLSNIEKPFFRVRDNSGSTNNNPTIPIAAISLDSSGTSFGAIDEGGMCCIWTIRYKVQMRKTIIHHQQQEQQPPSQSNGMTAAATTTATTEQQPAHQQKGSGNMFTNFVSATFKWQTAAAQSKEGQQQQPTQTTPATITENVNQNSQVDQSGIDVASNNAEAATNNLSAPTTAELPRPQSSSTRYVPTLTIAESKLHRVNYPKSFGKPTCLSLDPAYSTKRETSLLVAFEDGRIVFSKRGWLLQRREDKFIQYTGPAGDKDFKGIEAVVWRGSIVAFADCSGVRLYDTESFKPIAHVDRPTGARPSLYPGISVRPSLCFETSHSLLVAWGDCLLTMRIRETTVTVVNSTSTTSSNTTPPSGNNAEQQTSSSPNNDTAMTNTESKIIQQKKRVVECSMAWALDCVACGVVPLDEQHVVILGIVVPPLSDDSDSEHSVDEEEINDNNSNDQIARTDRCKNQRNELELQVISRITGSIVYSDLLPLLQRIPPKIVKPTRLFQMHTPTASTLSASNNSASENYYLLSSFAVPRMDDGSELAEELKVVSSGAGFFGMNDSSENNHQQQESFVMKNFRDSHIKWSLGLVSYDTNEETVRIDKDIPLLRNGGSGDDGSDDHIDDGDDTDSIDSDDYGLVLRPTSLKIPTVTTAVNTTSDALSNNVRFPPPVIVIASGSDVVVGRSRDIDDAISYMLEHRKKPSRALFLAIQNLPSLRRHNINEIVNHYFRALLRIGSDDVEYEPISRRSKTAREKRKRKHLSLRRMKLAAEAMPILLGGNSDMWQYWLSELQNIPGALFVVRNYLPVRDPILPKRVYETVLTKMLEQVESIKRQEFPPASDDATMQHQQTIRNKMAVVAENHFLTALLAWGTSKVVKEHIKLYEYQSKFDPTFASLVKTTKDSLTRREEQTAAGYLILPIWKDEDAAAQDVVLSATSTTPSDVDDSKDALYNVNSLVDIVAARTSRVTTDGPGSDDDGLADVMDSRVALDAMAMLCLMSDRYDDALRYYLKIAAMHSTTSLGELEQMAVMHINNDVPLVNAPTMRTKYSYLLHFIEQHHLYQNLLDKTHRHGPLSIPPIIALMRLVGLDLMGEFLIEHCVPPQVKTFSVLSTHEENDCHSKTPGGQRRGTLPVDLVAKQIGGNPKLLLWYLHLVFVRKPEVYVKFPNTANPPQEITNLHKKQLDLYVAFAEQNRDSADVLAGIEPYRVMEKSTPLLSFLKVVLQLGSIEPVEVGKTLQKERRGTSGVSHTFALELAYIMEHFGDNSEADSKLILEVYLHGAQSLMLAASYAQRNRLYTETLWKTLVEHCLSSTKTTTTSAANASNEGARGFDGTMFGLLLESAALSGADLAKLVAQIPAGMQVEGLKPRLVAAVTDYKLKVQMHESSSAIAKREKLTLMRELAQRARRGMRYGALEEITMEDVRSRSKAKLNARIPFQRGNSTSILSPSMRTVSRSDHFVMNYSLPIR